MEKREGYKSYKREKKGGLKMQEITIWIVIFKLLPLEKLLIAEIEMDKFIVYATSQGIHCKNIQE